MRAFSFFRITGPLLVMVAAACAGAARSGTVAPRPATPAAAGINYDSLFKARQDSARMRFSPAEVHFMTGMIGHHSQALVMSGLAPTHGANPTIQTLAARIINAQKDEIALMSDWLRDRGQAVPHVQIEGTTMTVHGADHAMNMPGMLTPEQIKQLDAARGAEFDRLFLTLMIQHHKGAVTMVHELFEKGGGQDDLAFKMASDIQVDQITEIARMEKMLAAMRALPARQ
jgi:uncharacterized protein (DUF305 family)